MEGQVTRIRRNSVFAFLSQVIRLATNFLMFVGIARLYGVEAFGQFTTAHTFSTVFLLFADFGFDSLLPTEIARRREQAAEYAQRYFSLKIVFALTASLAMSVLPVFRTFAPETRTLIHIFSFYVLFASLNNFCFALFKGFEQFQHETKISLVTNLLILVLLVLLGLSHSPLWMIAVVFVGTRIIGVVVGLRIASRLTHARVVGLNFRDWQNTWRPTMVFGLHFIFGNLFFQADTLLLAFWRGDHDVGIYQSVFKLITLALVLPDIAIYTMMPVLSRLHQDARERWEEMGRLLYKVLFLLSLPVALTLFVFAEQIIGLLYGAGAFGEAIPILRVFAITVFVRYNAEGYALMLTTSRSQSVRMIVVMFGTVLNIALNVFAIPAYGPGGAAMVSLVTNIAVAVGYITFSRMSVVKWSGTRRVVLPFFLTVVLCALTWNIRFVSLGLLLPPTLALFSVILYFVGLAPSERTLIFGADRGAIISQ